MTTQAVLASPAPSENTKEPVTSASSPSRAVDPKLVARLVGQARENGIAIDGENGLLAELTKLVVESALEGEITDHLGYDKHEKGGSSDGNSRNGTRAKAVTTKAGPVEINAPRDRAGTFEPAIVKFGDEVPVTFAASL